jgi:uncharacterized membrane protein YjfL (UPF0719 family)
MCFLLLMIPVGLILWGYWYTRLFAIRSLGRPRYRRLWLALVPLACAVLLAFSEPNLIDRRDMNQALIVVAKLAWLAIVFYLVFPTLGLCAIVDGVERDNQPVTLAVTGGLPGATLALAATPLDSLQKVDGMKLLSPLAFIVGWAVLELCTRRAERITIDRQLGVALRLAGLLIGWGLVTGTCMDEVFQKGEEAILPRVAVVAFLVGAIILERFAFTRTGPTSARVRIMDILAALGYVGTGVLFAFAWR